LERFRQVGIRYSKNSQPLHIFRSSPKLAPIIETHKASWNWFFRWCSTA